MFLLDTNVVSELRKASRCHPRVAEWQAAHDLEQCFLSVITIMEIRLGIELARRGDNRKAEVLDTWLERRVRPGFDGRVLPVDDAVAEACARLHARRPRSFRDGFILATAAVNEMVVVTRNTEDFAGGGVRIINPWD